jgi:glycosyltransferase involved in cell wall biosynthesis
VQLSIVVPVYKSADCLPELARRIEEEVTRHFQSYELTLVNDDSPDASWEVIQRLSMPNPQKIRERRLRCLWLTRLDPMSLDAGDLSYSFHLLTNLCRAGVRLTVLAAARAGNWARRPTADGVEWCLLVPKKKDAGWYWRSALWSLFSRLPNVAAVTRSQYFNASWTRSWQENGTPSSWTI